MAEGAMAKYLGRWRMTDICQPIGPRPGATLRSIVEDAGRARDQLQQSALVCRVAQHGTTGKWAATDPDGNELRVENGTGGLEIWRDPEEETVDGLRRRVAPRQVHDFDRQDPSGYGRLRAYQKLLDKTYGK
jgi:hypothetical protein